MNTLLLLAATVTPEPAVPSLKPGLTEDQVGPGFLGFLAMFFIVVIMFFLIRDMVRRVRRVRYRAQVEDATGHHSPKSGFVDIPVMSAEEVAAAGSEVAENTRSKPKNSQS